MRLNISIGLLVLIIVCNFIVSLSFALPTMYSTSNHSTSNISNSTNNAPFTLTQINEVNITQSLASKVVLKTGPYAYLLINGSVEVFDTSKMKTVARIKPTHDNGEIQAVAVSPDGSLIYVAEGWHESMGYQDVNGHGHEGTISYVDVVQINATTLQPIAYFKFEHAIPLHLAVSRDGKVYFGYIQPGWSSDTGIFAVLDFLQGKSWVKKYGDWSRIYDFEFSKDNKHVYYFHSSYFPSLYDYVVPDNYIHYEWIYNDTTIKSIALAENAETKTLYALINSYNGRYQTNKIIAINLETDGIKYIPVNYIPLVVATNKEGDTLYVIGYTLYPTSNNKTVHLYSLYKYTGLQPINPPYSNISENLLVTMPEKSAFGKVYSSYIGTKEEFNVPDNMEISSDGKLGFITTYREGESNFADYEHYNNIDNAVIIYDLEYMNEIKTIKAHSLYRDVAVGSQKIIFEPPIDLSWAKNLTKETINVSFRSDKLYVKDVYPEPNEFAKDYNETLFSIYAIFTEPLDKNSINNSTFWLTTANGSKVSGYTFVSYPIAGFAPYQPLSANTDYVVHISKSVKSKDGKPLYADVSWNFTTKNGTKTNGFILTRALNLTSIKVFTVSNTTQIPENSSEQQDNITLPDAQIIPHPSATENATSPTNTVSAQPQNYPEEQNRTQSSANVSQDNHTQTQHNTEVQTPSPEINPQPEPPIGNSQNSQEQNQQKPAINPQPEPPAPAPSIVDAILNFFKGLFGMK